MKPYLLGVGVSLGAGVGTAFFAVFHNPAAIAIGAALGVAIGAALSRRGKPNA